MIFLTVGTLFNFDRLVESVDKAIGTGIIKDEVFAQISDGKYIPKNMEYVEILDKNEFDKKLIEADSLLSHAGMGSITMALNYDKPILVMPRLKKYGEHVNDHQLGTAIKFRDLGHVLVAVESDELPAKIEELKTFKPKPRENQADKVTERIKQFLDSL